MDHQILPMEYKPPNYRMPPLCIASLKRRIQRPSYVPVDSKGERMPRRNYLNGATCKISDGTTIESAGASPILQRSKISSSVENGSIEECMKFHELSVVPPGFHKPMRHPPPCPSSTDSLPPICVTSDYQCSEDSQWEDEEGSEISAIDLDAMRVEVTSGLLTTPKDDVGITIYTSYLHEPNTPTDSQKVTKGKQPMKSKHTGARLVYVRTCQMLGLPVSQSIYKSLHLSNINLKYHNLSQSQFRALAISLAKVTTVSSLDISSTGLTDASFQYLTDVLKSNYTICELYAADNRLTGVSAAILEDIMAHNVKIEVLDISGNLFKDADAKHFAQIIQHNRDVHTLKISNNNFGDEAGYAFGRAISLSHSLTCCDLSWNQLRKEGAWQLIMQSSVNDSLKELDLSWNGLGIEGCDALSQYLKVNTKLSHLNIASNRITQEAFRVLVKGVVNNTTLQQLKVGKNPITHKGVLEFLAKLKTLQLSKVSSLCNLNLMDFSGILVCGEVMRLEKSVREGFPNLQFVFGSVSQDLTVPHSHPKQDFVKLTPHEAKCLLYETLSRIGIDPEYILPRSGAVKWQVNEFKETLLAMSLPITTGAIDLMVRRIASNGLIIPSDILNRNTKERRQKSCHHHSRRDN